MQQSAVQAWGRARPSFATQGGRRAHVLAAPRASLADTLKETVEGNKVVIMSKTYCPYCTRAKGLFQQLGVPAKIWELDTMDDGDEIQATLRGITGSRTVPQVFIGGKFIGGCDDTMAAHKAGTLKQLLAGVGYSI